MDKFSQKTIEELLYYVYILVDPLDNKIFYVGKGIGNRVFDHVNSAIDNIQESDKLNTIRDIIHSGNKVKYYILRHKLSEQEAYCVESVFIDFLTYVNFSIAAKVTNIAAGHYQWDKGIKTVDELELLYACEPLLIEEIQHNIMTININKTYNLKNAYHPDIYESTRKSWVLSENKIKKVDFVMSEYRGIIREVFRPTVWIKEGKRWLFEGEKVVDEIVLNLYLNKSVPPKQKGMANPIRYYFPIILS